MIVSVLLASVNTTFITIEPEAISCLFFHNLVCAIHSSSVKPQRASKKWWKFVFVGCQFYWKLFFIISTKAEKKTFSILRELWAFVSFGHYLLVDSNKICKYVKNMFLHILPFLRKITYFKYFTYFLHILAILSIFCERSEQKKILTLFCDFENFLDMFKCSSKS